MSEPIRMGVVGVGAIGRNHARIFSTLPDVNFTAVFDTNLEQAAEVAGAYGAKPVSDLDEFLSLVDAATVATPTVTHRAIGERLLHAGKEVLIEKPIADNLEDARALVDLAKEKGRILQVGHIERFNPIMERLESMVIAPRFIEAHRLSPFPNRSMDIGVVLDVMIHDLEIILHLVKSPVIHVDAVGVPVLTKREDIANARLRFENGCVANITASRISPEKLRKIRVFAPETYLSLDYQAQEGKLFKRDGLQIIQEAVEVEKDEPLKLELAAFAQCARTGVQPKVSGREASAALALAVEITRLIEAGPDGWTLPPQQ